MLKALALVASMLVGTFAHADQCQWNSRSTSQTARAIMANTDLIVTYCAKCGDTKMKGYMLDQSTGTDDNKDIHFRKVGKNGDQAYWQFEINKKSKTQKSAELDLAYTYILLTNENHKSVLVNVGTLANGCNPRGVEAFMEWDATKVECMSADGSCG